MREFRKGIEEEISRLFSNFLIEQLGEHPASVRTIMSGSVLAVRAENCLVTAEQNLLQNKEHWSLFEEVKNRQFEKAKPSLKKQMEAAICCRILNDDSVLTQDGVRLVFFIINENLEKGFPK
jgi:uncharacterized protein YbcI